MASDQDTRPLSPHLQVYRPQWTSGLSILHRITGAALGLGTLMIVWWLVALATGPAAYEVFQGFAGSIIGRLMLIGWSWALFYHMLNGLRHLIWDTGRLFEIKSAELAGKIIFAGSFVLTLVFWVLLFNA